MQECGIRAQVPVTNALLMHILHRLQNLKAGTCRNLSHGYTMIHSHHANIAVHKNQNHPKHVSSINQPLNLSLRPKSQNSIRWLTHATLLNCLHQPATNAKLKCQVVRGFILANLSRVAPSIGGHLSNSVNSNSDLCQAHELTANFIGLVLFSQYVSAVHLGSAQENTTHPLRPASLSLVMLGCPRLLSW